MISTNLESGNLVFGMPSIQGNRTEGGLMKVVMVSAPWGRKAQFGRLGIPLWRPATAFSVALGLGIEEGTQVLSRTSNSGTGMSS